LIPENQMVDDVRAKVRQCRGNFPALMRKAQVSRSWLTQFAAGNVKDPRISTLLRVRDACDEVLSLVAQLEAK
jgi:predicted transcriptional regulator